MNVDLTFGAMVAGYGVTRAFTLEEMTVDAIANRQWHRIWNALPFNTDRNRRMTYSGEQLQLVWVDPADPKPFGSYDYRRQFLYEASGNVYRTWGYEMQLCGPEACRIDDESVSYYDAADRLRVHNRHVGLGGPSLAGGVYEEYRYDALGRRVTTRSRSTASCIGKPECNSYLERTAWDGDQVLMENRASGRQGATSAQLNSNNTTGLAEDDYLLGRVRYTHAGGIDAPVTVIRQLMQNQPASVAVAPHANWQGDFEIGTLMSGVLTHTCAGSGCPPISWPGHQTTADGRKPKTCAR